MERAYCDYLYEITADRILEGLVGYGLFFEQLPDFLTSEAFLNFCLTNKDRIPTKPNIESGYIKYFTMRNINIPRPMGIPNPISYFQLCRFISEHWDDIRTHFYERTKVWKYCKSRIHIRKMTNTKSVYKMGYANWRTDGDPELDICFDKKFICEADISSCFPAMYTHSLPWALVGKDKAKANKDDKLWYNKLDCYTRSLKNNETMGLLIGPHASSILSEIILTSVDEKLAKWDYVRYIDDYRCYVKSHDEAELFFNELQRELKYYDLNFNCSKASIKELPLKVDSEWRLEIISSRINKSKEVLDYNDILAYNNFLLELMRTNSNDAAILNYGLKTIASKALSNNARSLLIKFIIQYTATFPYLLHILEQLIEKTNMPVNDIKMIADASYRSGLSSGNYDAVCYALYFAIKYRFRISRSKVTDAISSNDCILLLLDYIYRKKHGPVIEHDHNAKQLLSNSFGDYWLYCYEVLPSSSFKDLWRDMKDNHVSFLKSI